MENYMTRSQLGFISIELIIALIIISIFFLFANPKILLTEKMQIDFHAQYLQSNLRLIQQKNFALPHRAKRSSTPYIVMHPKSYEIHWQTHGDVDIIEMPENVTLSSNNAMSMGFNRGDKYTGTAATFKLTGSNYSKKIVVHGYGRIRTEN